jgi:hypothetical protein
VSSEPQVLEENTLILTLPDEEDGEDGEREDENDAHKFAHGFQDDTYCEVVSFEDVQERALQEGYLFFFDKGEVVPGRIKRKLVGPETSTPGGKAMGLGMHGLPSTYPYGSW